MQKRNKEANERGEPDDLYSLEKQSLYVSIYKPIEKKKVIEKIEIPEVDDNQDFLKFRILTRYSQSGSDTLRRYSDFDKLHTYLLNKYAKYENKDSKIVLLPKLPQKHSIQDRIKEYDEYNRKQFWYERKEDLEIYLNILIENDKIRDSKVMKEFLGPSELDELNKQISQLQIITPNTKPQKVIQAVKGTINNIYRYWENWNLPPIEVPEQLKKKLITLKKVTGTLCELLDNERLRVRCSNSKNDEFNRLLNPRQDQSQSLLQSLKNKIISKPEAKTEKAKTQSQLSDAVGKLADMMDTKLKVELYNIDKTAEIKKDLKTAMASCDAVLWNFDYICEQRPQCLYEILQHFDGIVNMQTILGKAKRALGAYLHYYRKINKIERVDLGQSYMA